MSRTLDRLAGLTDTGLDELDQDPQDPEQGIDEAARERTRRRYRQVQDPLERLGTLTDPAHKLPTSAEKPLDRLARLTAIPTAPPIRVPAPEDLAAAADDTQALPTPPRVAAVPPLQPTPESTVPATPEETAPRFDRFGEQTGTRPVRKPGEPPAIRALAPPGPLDRVAEAVGERVREKYRAKSAAPGAPSALPLAERQAARQASQAQVYGSTPEELQQDLLDLSADETGVAKQVGAMIGDFVDPAVLAGGAGAEMLTMTALKAAAAKGVPLAGRLLALTVLPEGAGLLKRLAVRAAHGFITGGPINVAAQSALTAEQEGRLPTPKEALGAGVAGAALGTALEPLGGAAVELMGGKAAHPPAPGEAPVVPRVERRAKPRGPTDLTMGEKVADALLGTDIKGLKTKAAIDEKTGALTADAGKAVNQAAVSRERQPGERFVRYRLDMDNFKALNDTRGHDVGDQALEAAVAALRQATREEDVVALTREGGDEFSLSLEVAKDADPLTLRDRLEQAVDARLRAEGLDQAGAKQVSASIGHAELMEGDDLAALDARADAAARARKAERAISQPRGSAAAVPEAPALPGLGEHLIDLVPGLREKVTDIEGIAQTAGPDAARLAMAPLRRSLEEARRRGDISHAAHDDLVDALEGRVRELAPALAEAPAAAAPAPEPEQPVGRQGAEPPPPLRPERIAPSPGAAANRETQPFESLHLEKPVAAHTRDELEGLTQRVEGQRREAQAKIDNGAVGSTRPFDYDLQVLREELERRAQVQALHHPAPEHTPPAEAPAPVARVAGHEGAEAVVKNADGSAVPVRYRAVEADALLTSHHPETFATQAGYPEGIQERRYHADKVAQEEVARVAQQLDPDIVLDRTTRPTEGPGISRADGVMLSGNQRTMALKRAYRAESARAAAYKQALVKRAKEFGLDPAAIEAMHAPVLTREVIPGHGLDLSDQGTLAEMVAAFNDVATKAKDPLADAATRARRLRDAPQVLEHFGSTIGPDETLREYLGTPAGRVFAEQLVQAHVLPRPEAARFIDRTGALTDEGKGTIERMLYAAAIGDPEVAARAPRPLMRRLEHAIPAIVKVSRVSGWDLGPTLREALDLHAEMQAKGAKSMTELLEQGALFGRHDTPDAVTLADYLDRVTQKAPVTEAFRKYADAGAEATGQRESVDIFGYEPASAGVVFRRLFGEGKTRQVAELEAKYRAAQMDHEAGRAWPGGVAEVAQVAGDLWERAGALATATDGQLEMVFTPEPGSRRAQIIRAQQPRAWVDVRGQRLVSHQDYHRFLHPFRDPRMERMHVLLLDDGNRILSHTMETSGAINFVQVKDDFGWRIAARAKRAGAARVIIGHNHPSGLAKPSAEDISFTGALGAELEKRGVRLAGHYVIDDVTGSFIEHLGNTYSVHTVNVPKAAGEALDWTAGGGRTVTNPAAALLAFREMRVEPPAIVRMDVLYLDSQGRALALEPHNIRALPTLARWLPQRVQMHGARNAVIGVHHPEVLELVVKELNRRQQMAHEDLAVARRAGAAPGERLEPAQRNLYPHLADVISTDNGRSAAIDGTLKTGGPVIFAHEVPAGRYARRVFEDPATERAADTGGNAPASPLEPGWRPLDDVTARRMGMPRDVQEGMNLMGEERRWHRAVTTRGAKVTLDDGTPGVVIEGATDPVNGLGKAGRVLVEHEYEGRPAQRWYPATELDARRVGESTLQEDMFGKPKLLEPEQRELLGEGAGWAVPKLKSTKIGPEEVARVRREGGEPAGERPADLGLRERGPRYDPATAGGDEYGIPRIPGDPTIDAPTRGQIVKDLAEKLEVPIRNGKMRQGKGTLGIYKINPEVIRVRTANDIETIAHEVGHHIHTLLFGQQGYRKSGGLASSVLKPWRDELKPLGVGVSDQSSAEGLAEFVRRYLTNPAAAKRRAPRFYDFMESTLREKYPDVLDLLQRKRDEYSLWLEATPRARLRAHVSTQDNPEHASIRDKWTRARTDYIDDMAIIERAVRDLSGGKDPSKIQDNATALARLTRGADGLAAEFIDGKAREFGTLKPVGKSLREVFAPVNKRLDDFRDYAVALRAQELHGRGLETGLVPADVAAVLEELDSPLFRTAFEDLQTWNRHLLTYLKDAGVISREAFDGVLANNKAYLPFYRVMDDAPQGGITYRSGRFGYLNSPVKRIKGSGREIIDPFESLVKNAQLYTHIAQRQQVSNALAALAKEKGAGVWIEKVPAPMVKKAGVTAEQMLEMFDKKGLGASFHDFLQHIGFVRKEGKVWVPTEQMAEEILQIWRPGDWMGEPNMISVLQKGQRVWYEVAPDLYQALMGLRQEHMEGWLRLLSQPARLLRAGATLAPEFIGRNPFRDQVQAFITSDYGFKPGYDFVRGLFHMLRGTETYGQWRAAGGERSALLGLDRKGLRQTFARDVARKGVPNVVYNPIEMLRAVSEAMENATRIGEFARAVGKEGTSKEGLLRAATAAREITVDFARHGAKTQGLRNIAAFWNARLQGYDRLFRAVKAHPVRTLARTFAGITLPSVALYYVNRDDPEYWELPQWQRDLFWCVKISGHWVRIPKPFELGVVFGSIPERILEWWDTKDPRRVSETVKNFVGTEIEQTLLPMPTFLQPLWDNYGNYSSFRRRSLIPRGLQDVAPEAQVTPGTSEVAAHLGRFLNYPPAKIDNLLNAWTGGLGRVGLDVAGKAIEAADRGQRERFGVPPSTPQLFGPVREGTPFVRGFVARAPGASSESVERFYTELASSAVAWNTAKLYERTDDDEALDAWLTKHEAEVDRYEELRPVADDIAGTRAEINQVRRDPELSADEKARQIRELEQDIMQTAEEAVGFATGARGRRGTAASRILGRAGDVLAGAGARRVEPRE